MTSEILHVDEAWKSSLCCPQCRSPLVAADQPPAMVCQRCSARHPVVDGIGQFADLCDFNEREGFVSSGSDFGDGAVGRLKLHFARHHYLQDIARRARRRNRVWRWLPVFGTKLPDARRRSEQGQGGAPLGALHKI